MGIHPMEKGRRRFTVSNFHLRNPATKTQKLKKMLICNSYTSSKDTRIYNNTHEIKAGDHFGSQAFFISNGN
jgi:hypothetical protein